MFSSSIKHQLLAGVFCMSMNSIMGYEEVQIKLIELSQIEEVKHMMAASAFEVLQLPITIEEFEEELNKTNEYEDLDNVQSIYCDNKGVFYIALDNNKVIGSGAIKKLDDETCELKRMWFLKQYRGKGFGLAMANKLFEFAKNQGYKKIRLDVYFPDLQQQAVTFYKKLGFYEIKPYNNSPAKLFMEKIFI